jgi:hypothetical protein
MQNLSIQTGNTYSRKKPSPVNETFSDSFQAIPSLNVILSFAEIRRIAREEHNIWYTSSQDDEITASYKL